MSPLSLQAGLVGVRSEEEVQQLETALKLLIYRAGGIQEAARLRAIEAAQMVFRDENEIPYEVMVNSTGSIEGGALMWYAKQDKLAHEQLSPGSKKLAVWADAPFINAEVMKQLPIHAHKVKPDTPHSTDSAFVQVLVYTLTVQHQISSLLGFMSLALTQCCNSACN